ncbi:MAG: xylose isomerase [Anaeroplasmataceae bacterium]
MKNYFKCKKIKYEGPKSTNPFAFKQYNPEEIILGVKMKDYLKFAMSWWHTLGASGADQFGENTSTRPWVCKDKMKMAKNKVDAGFELMQKLGIEYFCFHDVDIAYECDTLEEFHKALDEISDYILERMKETNIKCLWGTSNMFGNKRFVHGASTSPNANVFAYSAACVAKAMEITKKLGGENYVFWGGREGYETLLNTKTDLELDNFARFLTMARDYAKKIGFTGQLLIEPKPKEPTKHQYDFDTQTVLGFLRKYHLEDSFKINIEANHATLAAHTFEHELNIARINGVLGSVDANQGDTLLGWDTDKFPTNVYDTVLAMYEVILNGGLHSGGLNFDAKVRRGSFETEDIILGYIAGMDTFAKGLKVAAKLYEDKVLEDFKDKRYASYKEGIGAKIVNNETSFEELSKYAYEHDQIVNESGRQEMLEAIINQYIYK